MITYRKLDKMGRLAAQICQYTGIRLYAQANGFSYALPDWIGTHFFIDLHPWSFPEHILASLLPTVQLDDLESRARRAFLLARIGMWHFSSMQELYQRPRDNINIFGYLSDVYSLDLYHQNRDRIRSWFTWKPDIEEAFSAATKGMSWAGLHVRRGDYAKPGRIIPVQTHLDTLVNVREHLPIHVASDDPAVRNELDSSMLLTVPNPLPDVYAFTPGDLFDFWMLQHAKVVVGGGSAFSWWAAFLGRDNTLYAPPLSHLWGDRHIAPPPITQQIL